MRQKISLRIASILMFLHTVGHSFGALNWKRAPNEALGRVISGMQTEHFPFMGRSATLGSFYEGYGICMIFVLLLVSILLWQLSNAVDNSLAKRQLLFLGLFLLILAMAETIYFFPFAAAFSLLAGLCTLLAYIGAAGTTKYQPEQAK